MYRQADQDPEGFWSECARELAWFKPFDKVLDWKPPFAKWFIGGELNASYNCIDRHLAGPRRNKVAFIWEGEPGDPRVLTYQMLADGGLALRQCASEPRRCKGDRVVDLYAAGARSGDRDAGVRADRRDSFGDFRRILG